MKHAWQAPERADPNNTIRRCKKCPMLRITRHEPDNFPVTSWTEFDRGDGRRFIAAKVPACQPTASPSPAPAPRAQPIPVEHRGVW